jgi:hypothetical protein
VWTAPSGHTGGKRQNDEKKPVAAARPLVARYPAVARRHGGPEPVHDGVDVVPADDVAAAAGNGSAVVDARRH